MENTEVKEINLLDGAVIAELSISRPGNTRSVDPETVETDAEKKLLHLSKDLLDSPRYRQIVSLDNNFRRWLRSVAVPCPSFGHGLVLVPIGMLERVEEKHEDFKRDRQELIDELVAERQDLIEESRRKLGSMFRESDYVSDEAYRACFDSRIQYLSFSSPENLKAFNSDIYRREQEKLRRRWEEASEEIFQAMREEFLEMAAKLRNKLSEYNNGDPEKRIVFRSALLENLREFCKSFQYRNLTSDEELDSLVGKVRELIGNGGSSRVTAKDLKDSEGLRDAIRKNLDGVVNNADKLVREAPVRKFRIRD